MSIKTLIIMDYMGSLDQEPAEEAAEIAENFQEIYDLELDFDFAENANGLGNKYKLIIIDYGGLMPGAESSQMYQVREVCRWAEDHPSRLVLIYTSFTAIVLKLDVDKHLQDLPNVLLWEPIDRSGMRMLKGLDALWEHQDKMAMTIRTLLG